MRLPRLSEHDPFESVTKVPAARAAQPAGLKLHFYWDGGSTAVDVPEPGSSVIVGRSTKCDVSIRHASLSRQHAKIHGGPALRIEDLGSSNGTWVGTTRLGAGEGLPLGLGVVASLGSVMLVLRLPGEDDLSRTTVTELADLSAEHRALPGVIIADPAMIRLYHLVNLVADSSIGAILLGETGVGKEVIAETIHRRSARSNKSFVRLSCAALPDNLLESELFGYERGAFTGAVQAKPGLLETADGGSAFLDEIGEIPLGTQAKLLRTLESREVLRLGSVKPRAVDVRFIAATHRDLEALVASGRFREDLYFRLNGISLSIPALRERPSEIQPLAAAFAAEACRKAKRPEVRVSAEALAVLMSHRWPGNVRELRNVVERAVLLCGGDVLLPDHVVLRAVARPVSTTGQPQPIDSAADPPVSRRAPVTEGLTLTSELAAIEKERIILALEKCNGSQKDAAKLLGISRRTLLYRLDAHGLPRPRKRPAT